MARQEAGRVLVADDTRIAQVQAEAVLRLAGYRVDLAASCAEAVERFSPGLTAVLLDGTMEDGSGEETAARIRALPGGPLMPILLLSADVRRGEEADFEASPVFDGVLSKPLQIGEFEALLAVIRDAAAPSFGPMISTAAPGPTHTAAAVQEAPSDALADPNAGLDAQRWADFIASVGRETAATLIAEFERRLLADANALQIAAASLNTGEAGRIAHRLKGPAGMMGFAGLAAQCETLQREAQIGLMLDETLAALPGHVRSTLADIAALKADLSQS